MFTREQYTQYTVLRKSRSRSRPRLRIESSLFENQLRVLNPSSAPSPTPLERVTFHLRTVKKNIFKNLKCYLLMTLPKQRASCFGMNHKYHKIRSDHGAPKEQLNRISSGQKFIGTFDKP